METKMRKGRISMQDQSKPAGRARALALFLTFLKIGTFTFGGGYAMIPLIQREVVEKNKIWMYLALL